MRSLIISLLFISFSAVGQENNSSVFTLKPSLGINGCQIHGDTYSGYNRLGLFGGVAVNAFLNDKTSVELGFYFSQKGAKHVPNKSRPDYYKLSLNYIDLPLLLRYHVNKRYFITLGPSLAYLFKYKENQNYVDVTGWYKYNSVELALVTGLGRDINDMFQVEVRFSNSLLPIRTFQSPIYYPNPVARFFNQGYYNNIVTLMLTYKLGKRKKDDDSGS